MTKGLPRLIDQRFRFMITWLWSWACRGTRHQDSKLGGGRAKQLTMVERGRGARRKVASLKDPLPSTRFYLVGCLHSIVTCQVMSSWVSGLIDFMIASCLWCSNSEHYLGGQRFQLTSLLLNSILTASDLGFSDIHNHHDVYESYPQQFTQRSIWSDRTKHTWFKHTVCSYFIQQISSLCLPQFNLLLLLVLLGFEPCTFHMSALILLFSCCLRKISATLVAWDQTGKISSRRAQLPLSRILGCWSAWYSPPPPAAYFILLRDCSRPSPSTINAYHQSLFLQIWSRNIGYSLQIHSFLRWTFL